jgi:hypothetical protein
MIRCLYGIVSYFANDPITWSPLYGSIPAFVCMALIPEYIILIIYFVVGKLTPSSRKFAQTKETVVVFVQSEKADV